MPLAFRQDYTLSSDLLSGASFAASIARERVTEGQIQGVPPGHECLTAGQIKLHSSMTFI
jgi:hypothetical protein